MMMIGSLVPVVPMIVVDPNPVVVAACPAADPNPAVVAAFLAAVPNPAVAGAYHPAAVAGSRPA
jgi:hypothetical protein